MKKKLMIILLFIVSIIIITSLYLKINFQLLTFEEIIFYISNGLIHSDIYVFIYGTLICIPFVLLVFTILYSLFYDITFGKKVLKIKNRQIYPIKFINNHRPIFLIITILLSIISLIYGFRIYDYIIYNNKTSNFIEENYVDPKKIEITFKQKRNLIVIFVESLETTLFSKSENGYFDDNVIKELYDLLNEDDTVVFYNNNYSELTNMLHGSSWTTASVVSNTTALPFKIRINKNEYKSHNFMNGAYSLGDLLKSNGYYNEVISSSKTSFGGIKEYFTKHGNYEIVDIDSLDKYNLEMDVNDIGNWGFNDNYLFEIAKERLDVISKKEPFNLNLITIDTHYPNGFAGEYTKDNYLTRYENVYATESKLVYDFISYVKNQPYYKDTTILIVGDHLSMQDSFFEDKGAKKRYVYSCIINPLDKPLNNKGRIYTSLDTYPTLVSAIGGIIPGNRLGLGVNLFSLEATLAEKYGLEYLDNELKKKSLFYDDYILDDNYYRK